MLFFAKNPSIFQFTKEVDSISPVLLGRWQRTVFEQAVSSSTEREEIKRLRAELKRVGVERDMLKKVVTSCLL